MARTVKRVDRAEEEGKKRRRARSAYAQGLTSSYIVDGSYHIKWVGAMEGGRGGEREKEIASGSSAPRTKRTELMEVALTDSVGCTVLLQFS